MHHKHEDYKLFAVEYYLDGNSLTNTCTVYKCNIRSLKRWIERYNQENSIQRHQRPSIAYKVKQAHVNKIKSILQQNEQITMEQLHARLSNECFDFSITRQHLGDVVRDLNFTRKRTRHQHIATT